MNAYPPPARQPCGCYHERVETLMSSWTAVTYRLVPCAAHRPARTSA